MSDLITANISYNQAIVLGVLIVIWYVVRIYSDGKKMSTDPPLNPIGLFKEVVSQSITQSQHLITNYVKMLKSGDDDNPPTAPPQPKVVDRLDEIKDMLQGLIGEVELIKVDVIELQNKVFPMQTVEPLIAD